MSDSQLPSGYLIASRRVATERQPVRFMYREVADNPDDSGWRVFAGDEEQAYADDPDNLVLCDVRTIVAIDPSIASLLATDAPCAFEREDAEDAFTTSDFGFAPEDE